MKKIGGAVLCLAALYYLPRAGDLLETLGCIIAALGGLCLVAVGPAPEGFSNGSGSD